MFRLKPIFAERILMTVGIYKLNVSERLESVEIFSIFERNKELIIDLIDYCFSEGLEEHRVLKYIYIEIYRVIPA